MLVCRNFHVQSFGNYRGVFFGSVALSSTVPDTLPLFHTCYFDFAFHYTFGDFVVTDCKVGVRCSLFASLSASSLPWIPACALTQQNLTFHSACSNFHVCSRILSMRDAWILVFLMESRVVWLCYCYVLSSRVYILNVFKGFQYRNLF